MVKTKQFKFSILVDEYGQDKKYLKKLLNLLKKDYPFLQQANRCVTTKRIHNAQKGEVIVFGASRKYDFRVVSYEAWEDLVDGRRFKIADLHEEWSKVKRYLDRYADANHPDEYLEEEQDYYCYNYNRTPRNYRNVYVVSASPKKKNKFVRTTRKSCNSLQLEEVSVHHYFVKVGWNVYDIMLNEAEEEYVKINKKIYWVDRDSTGKGKLSVE